LAQGIIVAAVLTGSVFPVSAQESQTPASATAAASEMTYHYRLEASGFDNAVSNGFGQWGGGGLSLTWEPSKKMLFAGSFVSERRPGETEQLFGLRSLVNWSKWFYTDVSASGGGRDNPTAFFPRFRYDLSANVKLPWLPALILSGGFTHLYFGPPISGSIVRAGAVYYWKQFVMQGNLYFNNVQPGNHPSKSANAAVQYGREGRYWMGLTAGGGREAWQTLTLTPQDVEFKSYSGSVFLRKWLHPSYGVGLSYNYVLKITAYRIQGLEMKFFWDF